MQVVNEMEVLGSLIKCDGGYQEALDYRFNKAERVFRKSQAQLCGKGSHKEKRRTGETTAMASALHCSGTLAWSKELAEQARHWEQRMLRQAFKIRPREEETVSGEAWNR